MKALSVRQPWAREIADGIKQLEFRTWQTKHRGDLLICASSYDCGMWLDIEFLDEDGQEIMETLPLPRGCAMCIVDLVDIRPMTIEDAREYDIDHDPSVYAWVLDNVRAVQPDPIKGKLHLFDVPDELITPLLENEEWWMFEYPNVNQRRPKDLKPLSDTPD